MFALAEAIARQKREAAKKEHTELARQLNFPERLELDEKVKEWLEAGNKSQLSIDPALLPSYDASSQYTSADYSLPTTDQLQDAIIVLGFERRKLERVKPVSQLINKLDGYLPPPGSYYDQGTIASLQQQTTPGMIRFCTCCWGLKHVSGLPKCTQKCSVCNSHDHPGSECHMIYATAAWWRERKHTLSRKIPCRPNASELVYLIIAGIMLYRPGMSYSDPLVVNMDHPIVRAHYEIDVPKVILPQWQQDMMHKTVEAQPDFQRKVLKHKLDAYNLSEVEDEEKLKDAHDSPALKPAKEKLNGKTFEHELDEMFEEEAQRMRRETLQDEKNERRRRKREHRRLKEEQQRKADAEVVEAENKVEELTKERMKALKVLQDKRRIAEGLRGSNLG